MTCPEDPLSLSELTESCLLGLQLLGLDLVLQLLSSDEFEDFIQKYDGEGEEYDNDPVLHESSAYHGAQRSGSEQEVQVRDVQDHAVEEH